MYRIGLCFVLAIIAAVTAIILLLVQRLAIIPALIVAAFHFTMGCYFKMGSLWEVVSLFQGNYY